MIRCRLNQHRRITAELGPSKGWCIEEIRETNASTLFPHNHSTRLISPRLRPQVHRHPSLEHFSINFELSIRNHSDALTVAALIPVNNLDFELVPGASGDPQPPMELHAKCANRTTLCRNEEILKNRHLAFPVFRQSAVVSLALPALMESRCQIDRSRRGCGTGFCPWRATDSSGFRAVDESMRFGLWARSATARSHLQ
jgi:hypothetical protein